MLNSVFLALPPPGEFKKCAQLKAGCAGNAVRPAGTADATWDIHTPARRRMSESRGAILILRSMSRLASSKYEAHGKILRG